MSNNQEAEYSQLEPGHEFPPASSTLDAPSVRMYLQAVGEANPIYQDSRLVPPTAVAAHALRALAEGMTVPAGTIHVSQEFEFVGAAFFDDTVTTTARVGSKRARGKICMLAIDLEAVNQKGEPLLRGKTSFVLPG